VRGISCLHRPATEEGLVAFPDVYYRLPICYPRLPFNKLPEMPKAPSYPSRWLTDGGVRRYLRPLYDRMWRVMKNPESPSWWDVLLAKRMYFVDSSTAEAFVAKLHEFMKKHHVCLLYRSARSHIELC
jgi:hypothetical protein